MSRLNQGITVCAVNFALFISGQAAISQITAEMMSGVGTTVASIGTDLTIAGGTISNGNLFHSFTEFSVPSLNTAIFTNTGTITNIFSRVTGGETSQIDGTIEALGTANLWLINPNGINFGATANLNIGGSFTASTAEALTFGNIGSFSAVDTSVQPNYLLRISAPPGLQFGANSSGSITSLGNLQVDKNLTLVAGILDLQGEIKARNISLSAQENIDLTGMNLLSEQNAIDGGDIFLISSQGQILLDNSSLVTTSMTTNGGNVYLYGNQGIKLINGSTIESVGNLGGEITLDSHTSDIEMINSFVVNLAYGSGISKDIKFNGSSIFLNKLSGIGTVARRFDPSGKLTGGNLVITAHDLIKISKEETVSQITPQNDLLQDLYSSEGIFSDSSSGFVTLAIDDTNGGDISVVTDNLFIKDNSNSTGLLGISTSTGGRGNATGNSGNIKIIVNDNLEITGNQTNPFSLPFDQASVETILNIETRITSATGGSGNAGDVYIEAKTADISNGALITTGTGANTSGNGGKLFFKATESIRLEGLAILASGTASSGNAGELIIDAPQANIQLKKGAVIAADTTASGNATGLRINAKNLSIWDGSRIGTATLEEGLGALLDINVSEQILVSGTSSDGAIPSGIFTNSIAKGDAGSLKLSAKSILVENGARILASASGQGKAGEVDIVVSDFLINEDSQVSSSTSSSGDAGTIKVRSFDELGLQGLGKLLVETTGTGSAGSVVLDALTISLDKGIEVSASTFSEGNAGRVQIKANQINLSGKSLIRTNTFSSGNAGNIEFNIADAFNIQNSRIEALTELNSSGDGGDILINANTVDIIDFGLFAVDSQGSGIGGDIRFFLGDSLRLNNNATITSQTASSNGGNLVFDVPSVLSLFNNSVISTEAGTAQAGGDGGNILIDSSLLFGFGNSDIVTNAFSGNGGVVTINSTLVENFLIENIANPRLDPRNNITANSVQANFGLLDINADNLEDEPALPSDFRDLFDLIDPRCVGASVSGSNQFTNRGRGGIPLQPHNIFDVSEALEDPGINPGKIGNKNFGIKITSLPKQVINTIEVADHWQITEDGKIELFSANARNEISSIANTFSNCSLDGHSI